MHEIIVYIENDEVRRHVIKRIKEIYGWFPLDIINIREYKEGSQWKVVGRFNQRASYVEILDTQNESSLILDTSRKSKVICKSWHERFIICIVETACEATSQINHREHCDFLEFQLKEELFKKKLIEKENKDLLKEIEFLKIKIDELSKAKT